jgi:hypothetical protein
MWFNNDARRMEREIRQNVQVNMAMRKGERDLNNMEAKIEATLPKQVQFAHDAKALGDEKLYENACKAIGITLDSKKLVLGARIMLSQQGFSVASQQTMGRVLEGTTKMLSVVANTFSTGNMVKLTVKGAVAQETMAAVQQQMADLMGIFQESGAANISKTSAAEIESLIAAQTEVKNQAVVDDLQSIRAQVANAKKNLGNQNS